jgi:signal transduction histidine kinase
MASTAEGFLVVDLEGRVLLASQRFNELWQIPQGLMAEGRDDTLLRHVVGQLADPELFLERVRRIYASDVASLDIIRFKDGRVFERSSQPLVRDGRRAGRTWSFRDVTARVQAEVELRESQAKLRGLYHQLQHAREEERRRISRELHDELGQNITALKIDLAWLAHRMDPGRPALLEKLESMGGIVDATLDTARRVSAELRPGVLDSLGLAAAAEWLVRDFEKRHEVECSLRIVPDEIEVAPGLATDVFRILQETLTNVARHARAARVEVTLRQEEDMIELHVTDNGVGIAPDRVTSPGSLGLLGIRERLLPYPGALVVEAAPGGGTFVRVTIPIEARAD